MEVVGGAVVKPVVVSLISKLGDAFWKEVELVWGVKDSLEELESLLSAINAVLEDAELKSFKSLAVQKWLIDLKYAALDAEDVLDEFRAGTLWRANVVCGDWKKKVSQFFSSQNSHKFSWKMARKIKSVVGRVDKITEEMKKFNLLVKADQNGQAVVQTSSYGDETGILGRDGDKQKVTEWVINSNNHVELSVLPIIGLGGVGKTTLARIVFNDEEIEKHFNIKVWVFVGKVFEVIDITRKILELVTNETCNLSTLQGLQTLLREKIEGKRFLLVLDDVWNEDEFKWEDLQTSVRSHKQGNKILVTGRSQKVAEIMRTTLSVHNLEVLSRDDCWDLFSRRAFKMGVTEAPANLVKIGQEIVNKCGGLPLAAKSLGSVMAAKREEAEWKAVRDSELWRLGKEVDGYLPALRLSYDHLSPPQLKQCFAYCALFPKDFEIVKLDLIQLCMAQGFLESKDGMLEEDTGTRYFNALLEISFFQEPKKDDFGDIVNCKVHDLVHDLACSIVKDEFAIRDVGGASSLPIECRHLSLDGRYRVPSSTTIIELSHGTRKLRSLIVWSFMYSDVKMQFPGIAVKSFSLLRVLDLSYTETSEVPKTMGKYLKHLKYLDLSGNPIKSLPESISNLCSLQTLRLESCRELEKLPRRLQDLCNLRHLDVSGCFELRSMPCGIGRLTNLVSLPRFVVGAGPDDSKLVELKHLNQLRGGLRIEGLANVVEDPQQEAEEAANLLLLSLKTGLEKLTLKGARSVAVLESLRPPSSLKELRIKEYGGNTYPLWLRQLDDTSSSSYSNLVDLSLKRIRRSERLPPLGQLFPSLVKLEIRSMYELKEIGEEELLYGSNYIGGGGGQEESGRFSSLKHMTLSHAFKLETWYVPPTDERELFPALEVLEISWCPKLRRVSPCLPSSIVQLSIFQSNEELLRGSCLQGLSRLRKLQIANVSASSSSETSSSWEGLRNLTALEELRICFCDDLRYLPKGVVHHHFPTLHTLDLFGLKSLESLGGGEEGESPSEEEDAQAPPPLFLSLRNLLIESCPRLRKFPEWMRGLHALQHLEIGWGCSPELKRRCKRETGGEDWDKISHIPNIYIW